MDSQKINKLLQKLVEIENKGIDEFVYEGVNVFPIIRSELQFSLRSTSYSKSDKSVRIKKYSWITLIKNRLESKRNFLKIKKKIQNSNYKSISVLLFSESNAYYSDSIKGKKYHRHLDPFLEQFEINNIDAAKFHLLETDEITNKYFNSETIRIDKEINNWVWMQSEFNQTRLFDHNIINLCDSLGLDSSRVLYRTKRIIALSEICSLILKQFNPSKLAVVCFYCDLSFAMVLAANKLGIQTIDIQHGKQGEMHFCYSHNVINKNNVLLFPKLFWNWSQSSSNNINKFIKSSNNKIDTVIGGNLWMAKWKNASFEYENQDTNSYLSNLRKFDRKILFGTQPIGEEFIPLFVEEFIKENKNIFFGIRLHPYHKNLIGELNEKYKHFENVEIYFTTELPLYHLFQFFDVVLTKWSSIVLEAYYFNLVGIIVDPFGLESFKSEIEEGVIRYVSNKEELNIELKNLKMIKNDIYNGIEIDSEIIKSNIIKVFKGKTA